MCKLLSYQHTSDIGSHFLSAAINDVPIDFGSHACWVMVNLFRSSFIQNAISFAVLVTCLALWKNVPIDMDEPRKEPLSAFDH